MTVNIGTLNQIRSLIPQDFFPSVTLEGGEVLVGTTQEVPADLKWQIERIVYAANDRANFPVGFQVRSDNQANEHRF